MTTSDPTASFPPAGDPMGAPMLRPRALATQLFADALAGDPGAIDRLRWLAIAGDAAAMTAFTALAVAELDRHDPPALPPHRLDQLLAAVREATAHRPAPAAVDGRTRRS